MTESFKLLYQVNTDPNVNNEVLTVFLPFQGPYTITIGDTRNFGIYEGGGTVTEVKKPQQIHFVSYLKTSACQKKIETNFYFRNLIRIHWLILN